MFASLVLLTLAWSSTANAQDPTPLTLGSLVWSEEFTNTGALDSKVWTHETGNGNWGWGNGEVQSYTSSSDNIEVDGGFAKITVKKSGTSFTSARIKTEGKVEFKYGSVEARIKLPNLANGLWPAFWMLGSSFSTVGWPDCGEIDILEAGAGGSITSGKVNQVVSSAAHWDVNDTYASYGLELDTGSSFVDEFQVFRMDWTDEIINTFVDDDWIWSFDIGSCKDTHCGEFHEPFYFIANMAVGGRFTGIMNAADITASGDRSMEIDYIRIYDNSEIDADLTMGGIYQAPPNTAAPVTASPTSAPTAQPIAPTISPTLEPALSPVQSYDIDCGVPTCTDTVLGADANGATCYSHIKWLMDVRGWDENHACDSVARKSFPSECGDCDPGTGKPFINYDFDCSAPTLCNDNVLNHDAPALGATCGERISYLVDVDGWDELDACAQVAGIEFPFECGECVHAAITCGKPSGHSCYTALESDANGHTCRSRISWVVYATNATETEACHIVANEAGNSDVCGDCDPYV